MVWCGVLSILCEVCFLFGCAWVGCFCVISVPMDCEWLCVLCGQVFSIQSGLCVWEGSVYFVGVMDQC